jgi:hypothetical protein
VKHSLKCARRAPRFSKYHGHGNENGHDHCADGIGAVVVRMINIVAMTIMVPAAVAPPASARN